MKIRRLLATVLTLCLLCSCASAESGSGGVLDAIGGWFSKAWEDTTKWVSQAWADASKWVEGAWGDASKWVDQAWNDSSAWVTDIWGDVSSWAVGTFESASGSVSAWWAQTFHTVTETPKNTWEWIGRETESARRAIAEKVEEVKKAAQAGASGTAEKLRETYDGLLKGLGLDDKETAKVMETISAYAKQKGVSAENLEMVLLPYLTQLKTDSEELKGEKIPAVAVAQYLTGIFEALGIKTDEEALRQISGLDGILQPKTN